MHHFVVCERNILLRTNGRVFDIYLVLALLVLNGDAGLVGGRGDGQRLLVHQTAVAERADVGQVVHFLQDLSKRSQTLVKLAFVRVSFEFCGC